MYTMSPNTGQHAQKVCWEILCVYYLKINSFYSSERTSVCLLSVVMSVNKKCELDEVTVLSGWSVFWTWCIHNYQF